MVAAQPAFGHPVPFSYLDLQLQGKTIDASLVVHIYDLTHDLGIAPMERLLDPAELTKREVSIRALVTERLKIEANGQAITGEWLPPEIIADRQSIRLRWKFSLAADPQTVAVETVMFPYDPAHQTFVNVYEADELTSQVILDGVRSRIDYSVGTKSDPVSVIRKFVPAGIHHILIGPDHLLFLVGLLLLGGNLRKLVTMVTAFTIAHSVTLSLAALDIFTPPASFVEPAIALSIVYVGADNLLKQDGRDVRAWIALGFGFIHGFGFAYVLREMGLPRRALGWSLFSFNFGVEIGQLLVVIVVASALAAVRSRSERVAHQLAFGGSIVVIIAGAFWFIQRVFFTSGI